MKNKDKWNEKGAENHASLLMKMRFEKASYESFIDEVMKLDEYKMGCEFTPMMRHDQSF